MKNAKQVAAAKAVDYIKEGMTIGLGTGTTAYWAIELVGKKIQQGLRVQAVATSRQTELLAVQAGIPIVTFADTQYIDITIDGADEVDKNLQLIKGGGGALLREKIVAGATKFYIIIIDETKLVQTLGKFKLPVEVISFGWQITGARLEKLGCRIELRKEKDSPYLTDNGNYIIDCNFESIISPSTLHERINEVIGVVDNGLFVNMANLVIIGNSQGGTKLLTPA